MPALHLSVAHTAKGYRDNRRATATEIQALGGQVRPGEQDHAQARSPLVRVDDVFHVEQVDGLTLARRDDDRDQEPKWKTHRTAERMTQESGVHVRHERGDYHTAFVATVTAQIAQGVSPWQQSWTPGARRQRVLPGPSPAEPGRSCP